MTAYIEPSVLHGTAMAPPSKSIAHRMLMAAALAGGESLLDNIEESEDIAATAAALRQLGAGVAIQNGTARVCGTGGRLAVPAAPIDCGRSASTLRFLIPLAAQCGGEVRFSGAPALFARPLGPYEQMFAEQGLRFAPQKEGLTVRGPLRPGEYRLPGDVSSQFVSGLLFALPLLEADSRISITPPVESRPYIELTRQTLADFGVHSGWQGENVLHIPGAQCYRPQNTAVEGDYSAAAFLLVLAAVRGGVAVADLARDTGQGDSVILQQLPAFGCQAEWERPPAFEGQSEGQSDRQNAKSPGVLRLGRSGALHAPGEAISLAQCPDLAPALCVLALFAEGQTRLVDARRLRLKESDRLAALQQELGKMGAAIVAGQDELCIEGNRPLHAATAHSRGDHRIAMALATATLCAGVPLRLEEAEAVRKSWPGFFAALEGLGAKLRLEE